MDTPDAGTLSEIEKKLTSLRNRLHREVIFTAVLGIIGVVAVCAYSIYGYLEINVLLQPKMLVDYAGTIVQDKLPDLRTQLEDEVEKNAPVWAEELSRQAVASVPEVRKQLEDHIVAQVDSMFAQTASLTQPEMQKFLTDNKADLSRAIAELQKDDHVLSEDSIAGIEKAVNETLQADIKQQAQETLRTLQEMTAKGTQLRDGKDLNEFDGRLREIIMILRRFHLREQAMGSPIALPGG
jgi:hypothetical protein